MFSVKNEKIWTILSVVMLVLLALAEALTLAIILQLNMLPIQYVIVLIALMAVSVLVIALLMFLRVDGQVRLSQRIVSCVLAVLLVCFCVYISNVTAVAHKTIQTVTDPEINSAPTGKNMYVLVRSDDPAATLKDAANYSYGALKNSDVKRVTKFIQWIGKQTGVSPEPAGFATLPELADALLNKKVNAIIISGANIGMLETQTETQTAYADFTSKVKILAEVPFEDLQEKPATPENPGSAVTPTDPTEAPDPNKNVTNTPFAIYIGASDQYGNKLYASRSDVNILMVVNPKTKQILLINTPRDYYIPHPNSPDGHRDKLTHLGNDGIDCSVRGLENLYNERVDFYAQINFTGFETLIDAIGGITVTFDRSFLAYGRTQIVEGENYLTGEQALHVARERYSFSDGDNTRGRNQMRIIKAVVQKLASGAIIANYADILKSLEGMFVTDITMDDISKLVKMQLSDLAAWNIQSYAVTGENGYENTYTGGYLSIMYEDQGMVDYAQELIDRVIAGDVLTEQDVVYKP